MMAEDTEIYDIEDFLFDVMRIAREKFDEIDQLHPAQKPIPWRRLIQEIEEEISEL